MDTMCIACVARTVGHCCGGVEEGEHCLNSEGPVYEVQAKPLSKTFAYMYAEERMGSAECDAEARAEEIEIIEIKSLVKRWLGQLGLPAHCDGCRKLIITLVDEP